MKKMKRLLIGFGLLCMLFVFFFWQNNSLVVSSYVVEHSIDQDITFVHLSDLHSKSFGENNQRLIEHVKEAEPSVIFITGDLIDQKDKEITNQLDYIEELTKIAPVYVTLGNHEYWADLSVEVAEKLEELGAQLLDNRAINMNINGHFFQLIGLSDEAGDYDVEEELMNLINKEMYNIVLYHRPTMIDVFGEYDVELVFSGHAHGGQIRLPLIGGLISPGEGLFPTYTSGLYEIENTLMVVSRGLGNSVIPVRVFNRPEIVVVTLT